MGIRVRVRSIMQQYPAQASMASWLSLSPRTTTASSIDLPLSTLIRTTDDSPSMKYSSPEHGYLTRYSRQASERVNVPSSVVVPGISAEPQPSSTTYTSRDQFHHLTHAHWIASWVSAKSSKRKTRTNRKVAGRIAAGQH